MILLVSLAAPARSIEQNRYQHIKFSDGDDIFRVGNITYLADAHEPLVLFPEHCLVTEGPILLTIINAETTLVDADYLHDIISDYTLQDDVFTLEFVQNIYLTSDTGGSTIDNSAFAYLSTLGVSHLFVDTGYALVNRNISSSLPVTVIQSAFNAPILAGPFLAKVHKNSIDLSPVYRLYPDVYRTFLYGIYGGNNRDGNFKALHEFDPDWAFPMIP